MKYYFGTEKHYNKLYLTMNFENEAVMLDEIFNETVLPYSCKDNMLKGIDDAIKGTLENNDFSVQSGFGAEVEKEKTIIYCDFTDEELEISTNKFRKISETWFDALEEFKKTGILKSEKGFIN